MEARYVLPYNWFRQKSSRHWRQKNGIWDIAQELAGDLKGKVVLDAGCGDGWYSALMQEKGAIVHGTDFSGKAISFAEIILLENRRCRSYTFSRRNYTTGRAGMAHQQRIHA